MVESLDKLIEIGEKYTSRLIKDAKESEICFSEKEKIDLFLATEKIIDLYGDSRRMFENAYSFEHPLKMNQLMMDDYKDENAPIHFKNYFKKNHIELFHISLFHDTIEKEFIKLNDIKEFYDDLGMDSDKISYNVDMLSFPNKANDKQIITRVNKLQLNPSARYVKVFDVDHNSQSEGTKREFEKIHLYLPLMKSYSEAKYKKVLINLNKNNLKKINEIINKNDIPASLFDDISKE